MEKRIKLKKKNLLNKILNKIYKEYMDYEEYLFECTEIKSRKDIAIFFGELIALFAIPSIFATIIALSFNKSHCKIKYEHIHEYEDEQGFKVYKNSELLKTESMTWTKESKKLDAETEIMLEYDLLKIEDNIKALMENNIPHTEYYYEREIDGLDFVGPNLAIPSKETEEGWTEDQDNFYLTGIARDVNYLYYGYKIVDDDSDYKVIKSPYVNNLLDIMDEYPYFAYDNYYKAIYSEKYKLGKSLELTK